MTAKPPTTMIRSGERRPRQRFGALLSLAAALAFSGEPFADERQNDELKTDELQRTGLLIRDSSTDRSPARTAFPNYPRIARRDRIEGDATVCFKVDFEGRIRSIRVKNYTHRIFRRPALKAIRESSFEPLQPDEVLNTARTCRTYRFRLEPVLADNQDDA